MTTSLPILPVVSTGVTFQDFNLPPALNASLARMNFTTPTPVQAQAIPFAMEGKDVLGSAQTGTGKTGAFGIPLISKLITSPRGSALVLLPTRELAVQVITVLQDLLGKGSPIKTALLIGGEPMPKQFAQLKMRPRIIVGTPGRINDHLARGSLMLHDASFLVLDETDRMLDMGFGIQLEKIFKYLPATRQTLMFSATLPDGIVKISQKYLKNPERVAVGAQSTPAINVTQEIIQTTSEGKYNELVKQLEARQGSVIIFVKTKRGCDRLADKLNRQNFSAEALHGDLQQRKRDRVINAFRNKQHRILVATDIAARGLDIPHIEHVINYDLPQCPEDYIHRIGRTARAGAEGAAVCLVSPEDGAKWKAIHRMLNPGAAAPAGFEGGSRGRSNGGRNHGGGRSNGGRNGGGHNGGGHNGGGNTSAGGGKKPFRGNRSGSSSGGGRSEGGQPTANAQGPRRGNRDNTRHARPQGQRQAA